MQKSETQITQVDLREKSEVEKITE